jgi:trimeric autotransporter adhesin
MGNYSVAIGSYSVASSTGMAFGDASVAMGEAPRALGQASVSFGKETISGGPTSASFGYHSSTGMESDSSVAGGFYSRALGKTSVALGSYAFSQGESSVALGGFYFRGAGVGGCTTHFSGDDQRMCTEPAFFLEVEDIEWPYGAQGDYSVALGSSIAKGEASVSGGYISLAEADYSVAMGWKNKVYGEASVAFGGDNEINSSGLASFTAGRDNQVGGIGSVGTGYNVKAIGDYSVGLGDKVEAYGEASVAMGDQALAYGISSTAIGTRIIAAADFSTAFGKDFSNDKARTMMIGFGKPTLYVEDGKVGINTTEPEADLHVSGTIRADNFINGQMVFSPNSNYQIVGETNLINGQAEIILPTSFSHNVSDVWVEITPAGNCNGLWASSMSPDRVEIKEKDNGSSNISFHYIIHGKSSK